MGGTLYSQVQRLMAGESIAATLDYVQAPRSEGWVLNVTFNGGKSAPKTVACTSGSGINDFSLLVAATDTQAWVPGRYAVVVMASKQSGETKSVERCALQVDGNPTIRTAEMITLAALQALDAGLALDDQLTQAVDGISLRYPVRDNPQALAAAIVRYKQIVDSQVRQMTGGGGVYAVQLRATEDRRLAGPYPVPNWPI